MTHVRIAFDAGNHLGETPIWSAEDQALWWVNCEHPAELHRWHPASGEHSVWPMPRRIGGFVTKADGGLLVALADGICDFVPESGSLSLRAASPFPPHVNLHECRCDRQGRFWTGGFDTRYPADRGAADAGYCRLDGDKLTIVAGGVHVANGLAFSPDGRTMYAVTSPTRQVDAFDLDPATGSLSGRRPFVTLDEGEGFVDGATVDSEGGYWMANVAAGALRRYLPDGRLDRVVLLPFSNPTKPAFGGSGLRTLYVTTTQMAMPSVMTPTMRNGPVYALEPGESGIAEVPFAG
jgi:sugar lactone lactonase YvrE